MGVMRKKRNQAIKEILKAVKTKQRQEEIDTYGKTICHSNVVKSKKAYSRKAKHKNKESIVNE